MLFTKACPRCQGAVSRVEDIGRTSRASSADTRRTHPRCRRRFRLLSRSASGCRSSTGQSHASAASAARPRAPLRRRRHDALNAANSLEGGVVRPRLLHTCWVRGFYGW